MPKELLLLALAGIVAAPGLLRGQQHRAVPPASDSAPGPRDVIADLETGQRLKVRLEEGRVACCSGGSRERSRGRSDARRRAATARRSRGPSPALDRTGSGL